MYGKIALGVIVLVAALFVAANYNEIRFVACVAYSALNDRPPVRTDGVCFWQYLVATQ